MFGLAYHARFSLPKWQALEMTFFQPCVMFRRDICLTWSRDQSCHDHLKVMSLLKIKFPLQIRTCLAILTKWTFNWLAHREAIRSLKNLPLEDILMTTLYRQFHYVFVQHISSDWLVDEHPLLIWLCFLSLISLMCHQNWCAPVEGVLQQPVK